MSSDDRWDGVPVLVTGAQGFVGSWLAERLLDAGARVVAPRRDTQAESRFRSEGIEERCDLVQADIGDYDAVVRALHEYRVKAVFHLAAQSIAEVAARSALVYCPVDHYGAAAEIAGLKRCRLRAALLLPQRLALRFPELGRIAVGEQLAVALDFLRQEIGKLRRCRDPRC